MLWYGVGITIQQPAGGGVPYSAAGAYRRGRSSCCERFWRMCSKRCLMPLDACHCGSGRGHIAWRTSEHTAALPTCTLACCRCCRLVGIVVHGGTHTAYGLPCESQRQRMQDNPYLRLGALLLPLGGRGGALLLLVGLKGDDAGAEGGGLGGGHRGWGRGGQERQQGA